KAIHAGTRPETDLRIVTPVISLTKAEIVRQGRQLAAPFEKTWSCYQAEAEACGACESCLLRLKGFAEAGAEDPIRYWKRLKPGPAWRDRMEKLRGRPAPLEHHARERMV